MLRYIFIVLLLIGGILPVGVSAVGPCSTLKAALIEQWTAVCAGGTLGSTLDPNYCDNITDPDRNINMCRRDDVNQRCVSKNDPIDLLCNEAQRRGICQGDCVLIPPPPTEAPSFTPILPDLQVPLPTLKPFTEPKTFVTPTGKTVLTIDFLARYLVALYVYLVGVAAILAGVMYVWAGVKWLTSAGDPEKITSAKSKIAGASVGLILVMGSYVILKIVNPELVVFKPLLVEQVEQELLGRAEDEEAGGGDGPEARVHGRGEVGAADRTACPQRSPGTRFTAAFTTYYSLNPAAYGDAGEYQGVYKGSDSSLQGKGDFFCAVGMECSCPGGARASGKDCVTSKAWRPCAYFAPGTPYCQTTTGRFQHKPGQTVAASTCFPRPCKLKVGDRIIEVTDRGSGIIGTHFDLYLGTKGTPDFVTNTDWLETEVEIVDCAGNIGEKELARMRKAYSGYKPGICQPGYNC